ncbi:MAG: hypothetical protein L3J09_02870 [Flavobacteriaceae bacterium]|nr:hypothetical protein [Flavobacteriaceae bacterium]
MKKNIGTPKERWLKVLNTVIDPMVILPIIFGLVMLFIIDSEIFKPFKPIIMFLSAFGIGIGVNHFSNIFKEQTEYRNLSNKAEHTVRILNDRINSILRKQILTDNDKDTIDGLLNLMDYWKDYYDKVDGSKIAYHKKLKTQISNETDSDKKTTLENDLNNLEYRLLEDGLTSYSGLSGSTAYNYFKGK